MHFPGRYDVLFSPRYRVLDLVAMEGSEEHLMDGDVLHERTGFYVTQKVEKKRNHILIEPLSNHVSDASGCSSHSMGVLKR